MRSRCLSLPLYVVCAFLVCAAPVCAQIPGRVDTGVRDYAAHGTTEQPFTVQVVGARRTVENILLVKLALTNHGTAPLSPGQEFSGDTNPADQNRISALYAVDSNGRKKYPVIRDAGNVALCSVIDPPIQPGERRMLYAQLPAPPDTSAAFDLFFPKADPILGIPTGLPEAGQPRVPGGAEVVTTTGLPTPSGAVPTAPNAGIPNPTNNNEPNLYTNQTNPVLPDTPLKGVGTVQSANSTVPFTVDVLSLHAPKGGLSVLKLALTNHGSGDLEAAGQFTDDVAGVADSQFISGVYLVDPVSKRRYEVARNAQGLVAAAKVNPALSPGERCVLEAQFPALPATVKSVYVYFPHCTPIADVPVTR